MATSKKKPADTTLDKCMIDILQESWISPMYFMAGITELHKRLEDMSDDEVYIYMACLISPAEARSHVKEIYNKLQNVTGQ